MTSKIKQIKKLCGKYAEHCTNRKITEKIYLIRGVRVMLDRDLAELYGVKTKVFKTGCKA